MANVRFIDSLKVSAYAVEENGTNINIDNNANNYVLTATGQDNTINGEPQLQFDGLNLSIGGASSGARFEINSSNSSDLVLIRNTSTGQGIKVDSTGVLQLLEFSTLPTAIAGGFIYGEDEFWIGIDS